MESTLSQDVQHVAQDPIPWATRQINQKIPAGHPDHAYNESSSEVDLNDWLIERKSATFIFSVSGESMSGIGIMDGDKVIVDCSKTPKHGSAALFRRGPRSTNVFI